MRPLRRVLVLLSTVLAVHLGAAPAASAAVDDYPWKLDQSWSHDRYGFTKRQCVSFVAWRLAQQQRPLSNARQRWGSALDWDNAARRLGHGIGSRPVVGAVAHWNAGETSPTYTRGTRPSGRMRAGSAGHVGYVQTVHSDGTASVSHYNGDGRRRFSTTRVRAPRYLYVGVAAPR